jgi:hypothetical protein
MSKKIIGALGHQLDVASEAQIQTVTTTTKPLIPNKLG